MRQRLREKAPEYERGLADVRRPDATVFRGLERTALHTLEQLITGTTRVQHPYSSTVDPIDADVIQAYSDVLQRTTGIFRPISKLPYAKERIQAALERAVSDPDYAVGHRALVIAAAALQTFVSDHLVDSTEMLFRKVQQMIGESQDETALNEFLGTLPQEQARAIIAAFNAVLIERGNYTG